MSDRPTEVKCEGKCNFVVRWEDCMYKSEDKSEQWYGMYNKDMLLKVVCFKCYEKGVRFKE